jgi:hypothetical protein
MTRMQKKIGWSIFAVSLMLIIWYAAHSLLIEEPADLALMLALSGTFILCFVLKILLSMRPAYRWLTILSGIAVAALWLYSSSDANNVPLWIMLPGTFGFIWIRYIAEFRGGDFSSLNRPDIAKALALAVLIGAFVMAWVAMGKHLQKHGLYQNIAAQELIEWE